MPLLLTLGKLKTLSNEQLPFASISRDENRKHSTILRLINVLFSKGFCDDFLTWNERRNRADYETNGGKMERFLGRVKTEMYSIELPDDADGSDGSTSNGAADIPDSDSDDVVLDQYAVLDDLSHRKEMQREHYVQLFRQSAWNLSLDKVEGVVILSPQ